jgi:hypothetical protein
MKRWFWNKLKAVLNIVIVFDVAVIQALKQIEHSRASVSEG